MKYQRGQLLNYKHGAFYFQIQIMDIQYGSKRYLVKVVATMNQETRVGYTTWVPEDRLLSQYTPTKNRMHMAPESWQK